MKCTNFHVFYEFIFQRNSNFRKVLLRRHTVHKLYVEQYNRMLSWTNRYGCQTSDCSDKQPRMLEWARVAFVPDTDRKCFRSTTSASARQFVCVGGAIGVDACPGDSGGPFVLYDPVSQRHYQWGVASFVLGDSK